MSNTYTPNYNLAKPGAWDYDWDDDINGNFDIIDSHLTKVKISYGDVSSDYLINKIAAGTGINIIRKHPGANETLEINSSVHGIDILSGRVDARIYFPIQSIVESIPVPTSFLASNGIIAWAEPIHRGKLYTIDGIYDLEDFDDAFYIRDKKTSIFPDIAGGVFSAGIFLQIKDYWWTKVQTYLNDHYAGSMFSYVDVKFLFYIS